MNPFAQKILLWSKNYTNWLPVIQWTGWILLTLILAKLFWLVTLLVLDDDVSKQRATIKPLMSRQSNAQAPNVTALISRNLLGKVEVVQQSVQQVEDAPETKLNLKLRGIYAANNVARSNSIIEDGRGKQAVYFVNDKLQVSGRVFLRQVYADRVILENNGRNEELRLKDELPESIKSPRKSLELKKPAKKVSDKRNNRQISQSLNQYKKQLQDNPASLAQAVRITPAMGEDGKPIGFSIAPGKDKRLFTQLGLRRKDIVTSVNGMPLSDPQNLFQLQSEMQSMQEVQVEILRGKETISLLLNLNDKDGI